MKNLIQMSSRLWQKVQELMEVIEDGEMTSSEVDYVEGLFQNLDPSNPDEELSVKQIEYVHCLHDRYINGNEDAFEEWNERD